MSGGIASDTTTTEPTEVVVEASLYGGGLNADRFAAEARTVTDIGRPEALAEEMDEETAALIVGYESTAEVRAFKQALDRSAPEARLVVVSGSREEGMKALKGGATDVVVATGGELEAAVESRLFGNAEPTHPPLSQGIADLLNEEYAGRLTVDSRWQVTAVDERIATLLSRERGALTGAHLWQVLPEITENGGWQLRAARETGEPQRITWRLGEDDVNVACLAMPDGDGLSVWVRTSTDLDAMRRERDRLQRLLATIDDGIYTLDQRFRIQSVNNAITELTGYSEEELVGSHASLLASEDTLETAGDLIEQLRAGERSVGVIETRIERADGTTVPIETRFSTMQESTGEPLHVGVVRDITERKRYERTLTTLNASVQSYQTAKTKRRVWEQVLETGRSVLSFPAVATYRFDQTSNELCPVVARSDGATPTLEPIGPDSVGWQAFIDGQRELVPGSDTDHPLVSGSDRCLFVPVGDHGLIMAAVSDENLPQATNELVELLATNAAAALDRLDRETVLTRREEELKERATELERINRFNELVKDLNAALVDGRTRRGIEEAVCKRASKADGIQLAWLGERQDGALRPRAAAGDRSYLKEQSFHLDSDDDPAVQAATRGEPVIVTNAAGQLRDWSWPERALGHDIQSVVSLPLRSSGLSYGVLTVYANGQGTFDPPVGDVLTEFAGTIAKAIDGVEAKRTLASNAVTEVELRFDAPGTPLARTAAALGTPLRVYSLTPLEEGTRIYLSVDGTAVESAAADVMETVPGIDDVDYVTTNEDRKRFEMQTHRSTIPAELVDYGTGLADLVASAGAVRATVELPPNADVRRVLEQVREDYSEVELTARRSHHRSPGRAASVFERTVEDLTDRQLEVLRTSFAAGYFNWPRDSTGEEVASGLGITQPTFAKHLRAAQRKVFGRIFRRDGE